MAIKLIALLFEGFIILKQGGFKMNKLKKCVSTAILLLCLVNVPQTFACADCYCWFDADGLLICL